MQALTRRLFAGEPCLNAQGKRMRKDGSLVDVELFTAPHTVGSEQYGYLIFYKDITSRLRVEADLEQSQSNIFRSSGDAARHLFRSRYGWNDYLCQPRFL